MTVWSNGWHLEHWIHRPTKRNIPWHLESISTQQGIPSTINTPLLPLIQHTPQGASFSSLLSSCPHTHEFALTNTNSPHSWFVVPRWLIWQNFIPIIVTTAWIWSHATPLWIIIMPILMFITSSSCIKHWRILTTRTSLCPFYLTLVSKLHQWISKSFH